MSASEMDIAKAVLNRLNKLGIPPTPEHFAQCYEELSGTEISALRGAEKNTEDRDELLNFLKSILESVTETTHILSSSLSSQNRQIKGAVETLSQEQEKGKILQSLGSLINTGNVIANEVGNAHDELEDIRRTLQEVQMDLSDNERWLQQDTTTGAATVLAWKRHSSLKWHAPSAAAPMLTVAMIDLDHFKDINERYGYEVGDKTSCTLRPRSYPCCARPTYWYASGGGFFAYSS